MQHKSTDPVSELIGGFFREVGQSAIKAATDAALKTVDGKLDHAKRALGHIGSRVQESMGGAAAAAPTIEVREVKEPRRGRAKRAAPAPAPEPAIIDAEFEEL